MNSPVIRDQTCSKTRSEQSYGPKTAVSSDIWHFHRRRRCRVLDVSRRRRSNAMCVKCSTANIVPKTNTRCSFAKLQDPRTYTALIWPYSHHSKRAKPCQDGTVIQECSNANVNAEKKLRTSSVATIERMVELELPSPFVREPNKQVGLAELHQTGATDPKRSNVNVDLRTNLQHSFKNVSKSWAAYPTPPPGVMMRDLPRSHHQTCSRTRYDPPYSPQMAVFSVHQ
jgi:hypothetical protein